MKKLLIYGWLPCLVAMFMCLSFTACSDDDNETGGSVVDVESLPIGWSGDEISGMGYYRPGDNQDDDCYYEEEEVCDYYTFTFDENGICTDATYDIVFDSEYEAKIYEQKLNSGEWAVYEDEDDDDDDDDYYDYYDYYDDDDDDDYWFSPSRIIEKACAKTRTRAAYSSLAISVKRSGSTLYVTYYNAIGKDAAAIKSAMSVIYENYTYGKFIYGSWNELTGTYTCNNVMNIKNFNYEVVTAYDDNDCLTLYATTLSFPNSAWADICYETYEESIENYNCLGIYPILSKNGDTITLIADIIDDNVKKETVLEFLYTIDISNNTPILGSFLSTKSIC